jgi:hypothetical protein
MMQFRSLIRYDSASMASPKGATQIKLTGPKNEIESMASRIAALVQSCLAAAPVFPVKSAFLEAHVRLLWGANAER